MEDKTDEKLLIRALKKEPTAQVPFWFMRQAGRYLPEYRALRAEVGSFMALCFNPDRAARVTLQPLERFDMDAAILFSDILVVPHALGQTLSFTDGEGPQLSPYKKIEDIDFAGFDKILAPVYETIRLVKKDLGKEKALIGFAGAPWTVACYMLQGRGGDEFAKARDFALHQAEAFDQLMKKLVEATSHYLIQQIRAGVDAVQIFDSWAGLVPALQFSRRVIAPAQEIVRNVHKAYPDFPIIGFPRNAGSLYKDYADQTGVSCVGLDQGYPLDEAIRAFGGKVAVQGNLDPVALLAGGTALEKAARRILEQAGSSPFIFNLGHGIIKETSPEHVGQLSKIIRSYRRE